MNFRTFYHIYSYKIYFWLFVLTFIAQFFFWQRYESFKPSFDIVPPAPNKFLTSALSLGDEEFLFRVLGTRLQNSGDVFAGFVALKKYDYQRLYQWMKRLDELNYESNFIPSLAAYYYSQTQNTKDVIYIIDYLKEHGQKNINLKWWWLFQATFIAKKDLKDLNKALEVAYVLSKNENKDAPFWTKQMPAFIHEEMGDGCMAFKVIEQLIKENESGKRQIGVAEMNFMRHFIDERLKNLKSQDFDPRKCS